MKKKLRKIFVAAAFCLALEVVFASCTDAFSVASGEKTLPEQTAEESE